MSVKITNVKYKLLTINDVVEMRTIAIVNVRGLKATINHLSAMVHGLTSKKDDAVRHAYERRVKQAQAKQAEEEYWIAFYTKTLNKHNVKVN